MSLETTDTARPGKTKLVVYSIVGLSFSEVHVHTLIFTYEWMDESGL